MARKLTFEKDQRAFELAITKVDRSKLYGRKEIHAITPDERKLEKGYLDEWGSVVIASTGMGYLDDHKQWHAKAELVPVDEMGNQLEVKPSSFDAPIPLTTRVSLDEYCNFEASAVYVLKGFELEALAKILAEEDGFYTFPFCYRPSYDPKPAFLNPIGEQLFMIIGQPTTLMFLDKPQRTEIDAFEDEDDDDNLDFSMM